MADQRRFQRVFWEIAIVAAAVLVVGAVLRVVAYAGSLTPSSAVAPTMKTLADIYTPLVGVFDASNVSANVNGSAVQVAKCAVTKLQGGSCP